MKRHARFLWAFISYSILKLLAPTKQFIILLWVLGYAKGSHNINFVKWNEIPSYFQLKCIVVSHQSVFIQKLCIYRSLLKTKKRWKCCIFKKKGSSTTRWNRNEVEGKATCTRLRSLLAWEDWRFGASWARVRHVLYVYGNWWVETSESQHVLCVYEF